MPSPVVDLLEAFPSANEAEWRALVRKTLRGGAPESLTTRGPDGLAIEPLYEAQTAPRTFVPAPRDEAMWTIGARVSHPDPLLAGDQVREALAGGAEMILMAIDSGVGEGVQIAGAGAFAAMLEGVALDVSPIALDAGFLGPMAGQWLSAAAKGSPSAPLNFHFDPLSALALNGASPGPIAAHIKTAADLAARLAPVHPAARMFVASGCVIHEAGASPALELAFALASALAYAKALTEAGLTPEDAFAAVVLGLAVDADPLISIAKLRTARMAWARLTGACGVTLPARIEARSSRRMLTRADAWTNLVRLTAAGAAGAIGGADVIVLGTFTDAMGAPTPFARRMARNLQLILRHEGRLGAVADPVAGAGAFESLSRDLAKAAWARFNTIEATGGAAGALSDGLIARQVEADRAALTLALAEGTLRVVGVTDFRAVDERGAAVEQPSRKKVPAPDPRLPGPDSRCPPLAPITLEGLAA